MYVLRSHRVTDSKIGYIGYFCTTTMVLIGNMYNGNTVRSAAVRMYDDCNTKECQHYLSFPPRFNYATGRHWLAVLATQTHGFVSAFQLQSIRGIRTQEEVLVYNITFVVQASDLLNESYGTQK